MFAESMSAFFDTDVFAVEASWSPSNGAATQTAQVIFDAADETLPTEIIDAIARMPQITYAATDLVGLDNGEYITVDGHGYIVREVRQIDDGAVMLASLGALDN